MEWRSNVSHLTSRTFYPVCCLQIRDSDEGMCCIHVLHVAHQYPVYSRVCVWSGNCSWGHKSPGLDVRHMLSLWPPSVPMSSYLWYGKRHRLSVSRVCPCWIGPKISTCKALQQLGKHLALQAVRLIMSPCKDALFGCFWGQGVFIQLDCLKAEKMTWLALSLISLIVKKGITGYTHFTVSPAISVDNLPLCGLHSSLMDIFIKRLID